jgi:peptidyl-prolyl cis-trans isomerase D
VSDTEFATEAESRALARLISQTRDVAFLIVDPASLADAVTVSDDEIGEYYESRSDEFLTSETVDAAFVEITIDDIAKSLATEISEEEIVARYEADRSVFAGNEQRRTAHILLEVGENRDEGAARAELLAVRERILAGESFEDLARAMSEDAGSKGSEVISVSSHATRSSPNTPRLRGALRPGKCRNRSRRSSACI